MVVGESVCDWSVCACEVVCASCGEVCVVVGASVCDWSVCACKMVLCASCGERYVWW